MTLTLDAPPLDELDLQDPSDEDADARRAKCPTPDKIAYEPGFDGAADALAFAAIHDGEHGVQSTAYECNCGAVHLTTHPRTKRAKPNRTATRAEILVATFTPAPLIPGRDYAHTDHLITPQIAAYWLVNHNTHNRSRSANSESAVATDIMADKWILNGATICFDTNGALTDGQSRLAAIVRASLNKADIVVPSIVVTGLEPVEAQQTQDVGRKRTFAQTLGLMEIGNANNVAAIITAVFDWKTGQIRSKNNNIRPTNAMLLQVLKDHPEIVDYHARAAVRFRHAGVNASVSALGLLSWVFRRIDIEDHDDFFDKLATGVGLGMRDPIRILKKRLDENAIAHAKISRTESLALTIKAWNAYRADREIMTLSWKSGGKRPEEFPTPI